MNKFYLTATIATLLTTSVHAATSAPCREPEIDAPAVAAYGPYEVVQLRGNRRVALDLPSCEAADAYANQVLDEFQVLAYITGEATVSVWLVEK